MKDRNWIPLLNLVVSNIKDECIDEWLEASRVVRRLMPIIQNTELNTKLVKIIEDLKDEST